MISLAKSWRPLIVLILSISPLSLLIAQEGSYKQLNNLLIKYELRNEWMGSLAFSKGNSIIFTKSIGYSSIEADEKANLKTKYRIGSISKMLTSTMILQMVDEGLLDLNDPLSKYFPIWDNSINITIEYLLRHQSGIENFGLNRTKNYKNIDPKSKADVIQIFAESESTFDPGTKVEYNNANYLLLSFIIEDVDQCSFEESLKKRILIPLSMNNSHAGGYIDSSNYESHSYFWKKKWIRNSNNYSTFLLGAGSIVSTPVDINSFIYALFNDNLISQTSMNEMLKIKQGMGLGIFSFPFYEKTAYGHAGNYSSFESFTAYFPKEDLSFTLCMNANREDFNNILKEVLEAYFHK